MAKRINKLTALQVKQQKKQGWYPDGDGLYLQVSPSGTKSWVYRYEKDRKERRCGLGAYPTISLDDARNSASECRKLRTKGIDPLEHKRQEELKKKRDQAKTITFKECAIAYIDSHKAGWKNAKHQTQWTNTLTTYAYPVMGKLSVQDIDTGLVMKVLEPIWHTKTETATRVRSRIENVLDWAKVRKYRTGENPALWRGHLDKLLPKRSKVQKVKHFAAMSYLELPDYYQKLRQEKNIAAKALTFLILTATRSNEAREAKWSEISLDTGIWVIPDERMKAGREHRVPLTPEALTLLEEMKDYRVTKEDDRVFAGLKEKSISDAALLKQLKQDHSKLTVHGFRSTFRDWCAEMTNYPSGLAESVLAHTIKDATQAAYERGDKFEKRRKLMDAWSTYCKDGKKTSNVSPIMKQA